MPSHPPEIGVGILGTRVGDGMEGLFLSRTDRKEQACKYWLLSPVECLYVSVFALTTEQAVTVDCVAIASVLHRLTSRFRLSLATDDQRATARRVCPHR